MRACGPVRLDVKKRKQNKNSMYEHTPDSSEADPLVTSRMEAESNAASEPVAEGASCNKLCELETECAKRKPCID